MKRLFGTILLILVIAVCAEKTSAQNVALYGMLKANIRMDIGVDIGVTFNDRFGVKVGMMSDIYHPMGNDNEILQKYEDAIGKKYRLSYTVGPTVRLVDWLWLNAVVGYGEYGTYGYSDRLEMYGVSGKVKGLEAGAQLRVVLGVYSVELGYTTIPKGFSLRRPLHDITLGIGVNF